jgi:Flp pilus assembly protein TadG
MSPRTGDAVLARTMPRLPGRQAGTRSDAGQSLVEFALVVPIFLILVFAIVDFGMGFHALITVTNSAREGARIGAIGADGMTIESRVRNTADTLEQGRLSVTVTNAQGQPGESVVVDVDYEYDFITPLATLIDFVGGDAIGSSLTLSSTADMRME